MHWLLLQTTAYANEGEAISFDPVTFFISASWEVKLVMVVLVLMVLAVAVLFVERGIAFFRARGHSVALAHAIVRPMRAYDIDAAMQVVQSDDYKVGYLTALLKAGFAEMQANPNQLGIENAARAIDKADGEQVAKLKRWFGILATTGSTAPFVGLAGTTRGVISAFTAMGMEGAGLSSISIGISEALWTTFFGIVVAIVGVWAFNFFNGRLEKVQDELHTARSDFLNWAANYVADGGVPRHPPEIDADEQGADAGLASPEPSPAGK